MMIAVMAVMCLTASAQNHRRDGGSLTIGYKFAVK